MRQILFRGKRTDNGKWIIGYYVHQYNMHSIYVEDAINSLYDSYDVDPSTVGQFTGLTDKNGNKIFEDDKVHVDCSGVGGCYNDGVYKVKYIVPDCGFFLVQLDEQNAIPFNECYSYEVIGNIHDNPELI